MEIKYKGHTNRTENAKKLWLKIVKDYNGGLTVEEIRDKYKNPSTGKKYTRPYIYWVFKRVQNL